MILIVGAGGMAQDYTKVLQSLKYEFKVIGRGETSAKKFEKVTGVAPITGGLDSFRKGTLGEFDYAIVTTGVEQLFKTTVTLIKSGIKNILVEKPGGVNVEQIELLNQLAEAYKTNVYVAYNRRFYASLIAAKEIIEEDGGVQSFNFELTEWGHVISKLEKGEGVKENWFLANTTHVADMAFFLGGFPEQISCFYSGGVDWHPRSYNFSGAGISKTGALFSYSGNWGAPGRWAVEVLTSSHRLIFKPMEKLQIQNLGSVSVEFVDIDDELDVTFKPGLYKQVVAFVENATNSLCSLKEQAEAAKWYAKIAGYIK